MRIVYIVRRFPKLSETFVLNEVREVLRQGDEVTVVSLAEPHADEPRHPGAEALLPRTVYGPRGEDRVRRLALAGARALLRRPRRAWPALAWAARAALRERLRTTLPARPDGSIALTARAWAARGRAPS
jgi:hypothetical protein